MKNETGLMYHSVGGSANAEAGAELYSVSVESFREQMGLLRPAACGGLPSNDTVKPVIITFDDGLADNHTNAFPILKEFGLKAYFFILVARIGTAGYMSWEQIKDLRDAGMVIGSHGMTHRILTELSDEDLDHELKESKKILEEKLKTDIDYLSIPRGFYNDKVMEKAKESGYKTVFTSDNRIAVKGSWGLAYFKRVLERGLSGKDKMQERLKNSAKRLLGTKNYDWMRTRILAK